jgi:hypothetical protein
MATGTVIRATVAVKKAAAFTEVVVEKTALVHETKLS